MLATKSTTKKWMPKLNQFSILKNCLLFNFTFYSYDFHTIGIHKSMLAATRTIKTSQNINRTLTNHFNCTHKSSMALNGPSSFHQRTPHHSHHHEGMSPLHQGMLLAAPTYLETLAVCMIALAVLRLIARLCYGYQR